MRTVELKNEDIELFLDMDPFRMIERLNFPDTIALGAFDLNEETGDDVPMGVIVCTDSGEDICIEWLCVSVNCRGEGVGESLIAKAFEIAGEKGYKTISAYINDDYGRDSLCSGEQFYLNDKLFTEEKALGGEWIVDCDTILNSKALKDKGHSSNVRAIPLRALGAAERTKAIEIVSGGAHTSSLFYVAKNPKVIDADVSFVLTENGQISGGLLLQSIVRTNIYLEGEKLRRKKETVVYPVCMSIKSKIGLTNLVVDTLEAIEEKYGEETEVHFILHGEKYVPLLEYILPESRINAKFLIASVEEYQAQKAEADQEEEYELKRTEEREEEIDEAVQRKMEEELEYDRKMNEAIWKAMQDEGD